MIFPVPDAVIVVVDVAIVVGGSTLQWIFSRRVLRSLPRAWRAVRHAQRVVRFVRRQNPDALVLQAPSVASLVVWTAAAALSTVGVVFGIAVAATEAVTVLLGGDPL